jgi:hypothetical protein
MFWASSWTWSCPCLSAVHYLFGAPFAINVLLPYLKTVSVSIAFAPDLSCRSAMRLVLQGLDMKRLPGAGGHSTCAKERKKTCELTSLLNKVCLYAYPLHFGVTVSFQPPGIYS